MSDDASEIDEHGPGRPGQYLHQVVPSDPAYDGAAGGSPVRHTGAPAQPVAWTNAAQLGFLQDPAWAMIPMAMWAERADKYADIALYAAQPPSAPVETRKTFTIPPGYEAVRDGEGWATGEVRPQAHNGSSADNEDEEYACPACGDKTRSVIQCAIECRARNEAAAVIRDAFDRLDDIATSDPRGRYGRLAREAKEILASHLPNEPQAARTCATCGGFGRIAHESGGYGINCPACTVTRPHQRGGES